MTERFADNPLDGVTGSGPGGEALGDDHTQSCRGFGQCGYRLRMVQSQQRPTGHTFAFEDIGEFRGAVQSRRFGIGGALHETDGYRILPVRRGRTGVRFALRRPDVYGLWRGVR